MKTKKLELCGFLNDQSSVCHLFYAVILFLPEPFIIEAPGIRGYIASCIFNLLICVAFANILCFFGRVLLQFHKYAFVIWHILLHFVFILYSISELYLILAFNLRWNAFTFQLLRETTTVEVGGFIEIYVVTWQFLVPLVILACLLLGEYLLWRNFNTYGVPKSKILLLGKSIFFGLSIILLLAEVRCFTFNQDINHSRSDKFIRRDGLWNLYQSVLQFNADKDMLNVCIESQKNLKINSCSYSSQNIILVIGETYNKHHSNLYGYGLNTSPKCQALNPIVFDDVISPANATTTAFKYFLSFAESHDTLRWCDTPLFPALFKAVGYNVVFYSNQYVVEGNLDYYDASAGFFNHPAIYSQLFNYRNHQCYEYDMTLVDEVKRDNSKLADSLNFVIIHLHGQHSPAIERFPKEFAHFSKKNILRPELTNEQLQYIVDYDNATLYNDSVVSEIVKLYNDRDAIVLYFADHGEEVYDCRNKAGRFFDFEKGGAGVLHNQLDVPFWVFASDRYKELHPDMISAIISAKHRPFMTDELPHLMLWLAGINSDWYDETKCLFSPKYDCERKRVLVGIDINYNDYLR